MDNSIDAILRRASLQRLPSWSDAAAIERGVIILTPNRWQRNGNRLSSIMAGVVVQRSRRPPGLRRAIPAPVPGAALPSGCSREGE